MSATPVPAAGTPEDPVLAAGVVLWRGRPRAPEFLLLRSARHHTWGLPKGHCDPGEELLATARREVAEETGWELPADGLRDDFADTCLYQPQPGRWKRVVLFLARAPMAADGFRPSDEHDLHVWLSADEACARVEHDATRRTIRRAAARLAEAAPGMAEDDA